MKRLSTLIISSAVLLYSMTAQADDRTAALTRHDLQTSAFLTVHGETKAPIGYTMYCQERSWACKNTTTAPKDAQLTAQKKADLDYINRWVNKTISPVSDADHYGVPEYWTIPTDNKGDCEDYALMKRKMLMDRGWPESALLLSVVRDQKGDGHAVLTVRTNDGDLVLDNVHDQIITWNQTGYRFVKRQSQWNPSQWVALGNEEMNAARPVASQRR